MKKTNKFDPLDEKVDLAKLLGKIYFVEENVNEANLEQAVLQYTASRYRVQCMRRRLQLDTEYELARSKAARDFRKINRDGKTLTEATIREMVERHPEVNELKKKLDEATVNEELAKHLFEVFKQRQSAIKNVVEVQKNNIARELWKLETHSKNEKLKAAAKVIRSKYRREDEEEDE